MISVKRRGQILVMMIVLIGVSLILVVGLLGWASYSQRMSQRVVFHEQDFHIAEAGIEYYRWHLAHAREDYQDGQSWCCALPPCSVCGPYAHDYYDKDNNKIGQFTLNITPPPVGSTLVTIRSIGKVIQNQLMDRTVEASLAIPSFARYAVVANDTVNGMRFGSGTEVYGPIHNNGGIRFDGRAHNLITSAKDQYDDPDSDDCNNNISFGVHTCVNPHDPSPPAPVPPRTDVFMAGRQFPVPAVDFVGISSDLAQIKADAQANGLYFALSGALGYHIVFKTNDTFDLYKVTSLKSPPNRCTNSQNQDGWGTWSIQNETLLQNYAFPANGLVFIEDNLWVSGQINSARLTVASGRFPQNPATDTSITVNNDLRYTNYDGSDVLGLITQKNFNVGLYSEDDLQIDGAIIAQNGRAGRYYYGSRCGSEYIRQKLTLNGMIGTSQRYGFAYTDGTGYQTRILNYDANLLYSPPPSYPLTSDQYTIVLWKEIN